MRTVATARREVGGREIGRRDIRIGAEDTTSVVEEIEVRLIDVPAEEFSHIDLEDADIEANLLQLLLHDGNSGIFLRCAREDA